MQTAVWPSTGNFGIGGAWVARSMGYRAIVVLPEDMSRERYERIAQYGAEIVRTPGSEADVKDVFDKVAELAADPMRRPLDQFSEFANYRFHYEVTGSAVSSLAASLGYGRVAAFVSAMGSGGTIAAGDRLKKEFGTAIVGLEPAECPTLHDVGFGSHRIEGIGDKHVTWIHNVHNMDLLLCIEDQSCLDGLELLQKGTAILEREGVPGAERLVGIFGVSGVCNLLGAIKTARHYGLGRQDLVVTVATDGFDRYPSVLARLEAERGPMSELDAVRRLARIFRGARADHALEATRSIRRRWHNQKYFTWVEQRGKTRTALDAQTSPDFWQGEQAKVRDVDARIRELRG